MSAHNNHGSDGDGSDGDGSDGDGSDEDYSRCDSSDESDGCLTDDVRMDSSDSKTEPEVQKPMRVLCLGSWCKTRWNNTFYLIKWVVLLEEGYAI